MYTRNCEIKPGRDFPRGMQRIALGLEYCGTQFHGFQIQQSAAETIQAHLHRALSKVADEEITLVCAGRTDAGVHATEQVVHFDTLSNRPDQAWTLGANALLPPGISIHWAKPVSSNFHARFSAVSRRYRYLILNRPTRPAIQSDTITWFKRPLNFNNMLEAASVLVGEHDFSALRASQCQAKSPVRSVYNLRMAQQGELIAIDIQANAFLHHMVRNIAGCLLTIGAGDKEVGWMKTVLDSGDRNKAAATASPRGLYLVGVEYPEEFNLPHLPLGPLLLPGNMHWQAC